MTRDPAPAPTATPPPGPPAGLLLDRPRPCARCTYDLFRQPLDGKCPECGTDVAESLRARYLRDAGPGYLRALRQGANLILALVLISLVALGVGLVSAYLLRLAGLWQASFVFQALLDLGFLAATWRLTVADPGRPRPVQRWGARAVVLLLAVVQLGVTAFVIGYVMGESGAISLPAARRLWAMLVTVTALEAASTLVFGFTVAELSQRLPAPGLARAIRVATLGLFLALLAALGGFALFLAMLHGLIPDATAERFSDVLAWPENAGRVVFGVAAAVLLWTFARRLRAEAAEVTDPRG